MLFAGDLNMDTTIEHRRRGHRQYRRRNRLPGQGRYRHDDGRWLRRHRRRYAHMSAANNTITTDTGQILKITDMTIDANTT